MQDRQAHSRRSGWLPRIAWAAIALFLATPAFGQDRLALVRAAGVPTANPGSRQDGGINDIGAAARRHEPNLQNVQIAATTFIATQLAPSGLLRSDPLLSASMSNSKERPNDC